MNRKFREGVRKRMTLTKQQAELIVQKTLIDLASSVVMMSPVDTGRFRANWQFGNGAINAATSADMDLGGARTVARLSGSISSGVKLGQVGVVYITNSLPYAFRLEYDGWSRQAPAGMVRVSVDRFAPTVRRVARAIAGAR